MAPGPGSLYGGALGTAYGRWLGSMIDGYSPGDAAENGLTDGVMALTSGYIFAKIGSKLRPLIRGFLGKGAAAGEELTPTAAGVSGAVVDGADGGVTAAVRPHGRPGWENKPFPNGGGKFSDEAYPIFDNIYADVTITPTGDRIKDFAMAELKAGIKRSKVLSWHHHEDVGRMQLVDRDTHAGLSHRGGWWLWGQIVAVGGK